MELSIKEKPKTDKKIIFADIVGCESKDEEFYLSEETSDETMVHPEAIISISSGPRSNKKKTVRCLLDICATISLADQAFCN